MAECARVSMWKTLPPPDHVRTSGRPPEQKKGKSYHVDEQGVDVKVGLLLHAADDAALDDHAPALHLQAGAGNARHLEALQVPHAPRQDLRRVEHVTAL